MRRERYFAVCESEREREREREREKREKKRERERPILRVCPSMYLVLKNTV